MKTAFNLLMMNRAQLDSKLWAVCLLQFAISVGFVPYLGLNAELLVLYIIVAIGFSFLPASLRLFQLAYRDTMSNFIAASQRAPEKLARTAGINQADMVLVAISGCALLGALVLFWLRWPQAVIALFASLACLLAFGVGNVFRLLLLAAHAKEAGVADLNVAILENNLQQPLFAFHFSAPDLNTPSHVLMWLSYLEALGMPFFIIVRERKHLLSLAVMSKVPVILATEAQLKTLIPPSVTTIFYANNASGNLALINGRPDLQHVQLLHGDSDKPASFSPVSKIFSKLFVAGQMAIDRYERNNVPIPLEKFVIVGRPQVARITAASVEKNSPITVAYLPTWIGYHEDAKFSSLAQAARIIDKMMSGSVPVKVLFKPHPMSHKDPASARHLGDIRRELSRPRANGSTGEFHEDAIDPIDLYNMADLLISDISSVIIDFLYSGKPYLVTNPSSYNDEQLKAYPSVLGGYVLDAAGEDVADLVVKATGEDPMRDKRMATRSYAFGDLDHAPAALFMEQCSACILSGRES